VRNAHAIVQDPPENRSGPSAMTLAISTRLSHDALSHWVARPRRGSLHGDRPFGGGGRAAPVNWADVVEKLNAGSTPAADAHNARTTWLATISEDGSPHVTAVGAVWLDDAYWL
jgi:hypothetical protein